LSEGLGKESLRQALALNRALTRQVVEVDRCFRVPDAGRELATHHDTAIGEIHFFNAESAMARVISTHIRSRRNGISCLK